VDTLPARHLRAPIHAHHALRGSRVIAPFFGAFFGIFTAGLGFVDFGGITFLAMTYLL
jgi:hypothetical protein